MRDPYNLNTVEHISEDPIYIKIDDIPEYDLEDYDLLDTKDFKAFISDIKRVVRNSFEYRQLVNFLRENMDMNKCSFYENVNNIDTTKIKIHIHHHPFTLEDIALIVFNKRSLYRESLELEMIAKEVMYIHYHLLVGLIPLSETVHELVHNNYLFIPLDKVVGNFNKFIEMYENYMTPEQLDVLQRNIECTQTFNENKQKDVLAKRYVYIDTTGVYDMPPLESIVDMMNEKIKEIQGVALLDFQVESEPMYKQENKIEDLFVKKE